MTFLAKTSPARGFSLGARLRGASLALVALAAATSVFVLTITSTTRSVATAETVVPDESPSRSTAVPVVEPATPEVAPVGTQKVRAAARAAVAPGAVTRGAVAAAPVAVGAGKSAVPAAVASTPGPAGIEDASLGFSPSRDGFSFDNWAGVTESGRVTEQMLVRMFGARSVCADGIADPCTASPAARRVLDAVNGDLVNGRCEGMVAFAALSFESGSPVGAMSFADAQSEIAYWYLSQLMPRVAAREAATRSMTPMAIVQSVARLMKQGRTVTLTITAGGVAHAVLPVAVRSTGTTLSVDVYDPNYAGQTKTLTVDPASGTWSYGDAVNGSGARVTLQGQGAGQLGFVENSLRQGTQAARFAD